MPLRRGDFGARVARVSSTGPSDPPASGGLRRLVTLAYEHLVGAICAHRLATTLIVLLLLAPSLVLSARYFMDIHAGMEDLLPKDAPSVQALDRIHERVGGVARLNVIAHGPNRADNERFIRELAKRLEARKIPQARWIQATIDKERSWADEHAPLLLSQKDFDSLMKDVDHAVDVSRRDANPFYVDLETSPKEQWDHVQKRVESMTKGQDRFPRGYFESKDGHTVVLMMALRGSEVDVGPSDALLKAVKAEVAGLRPAFPASLQVAYNGEVVNLLEEHAAIQSDLSLSSILVVLLVGLLIVAYFRTVRAILAVVLGLVPGLLFTFGLGRLSGSFLNSNSAFLGAIIAGNGINYPLMFLAYYRAQPSTGTKQEAIVAAAKAALPGTLAASATASAAYFGLATATFRGFSQFGWLGGVGMVTTWAIAFLLMPLTIAWLAPPRRGEQLSRFQQRLTGFFARPWAARVVAFSVVIASLAVGGIGLRRAIHNGPYDENLLHLRNTRSLRSGGASWDAKMSDIFGVWMNPIVVLVKSPADRERAATALRQRMVDGPQRMAERVETIEEYVHPEAEQRARIARLEKLRDQIKSFPKDSMPDKTRKRVDSWLSAKNLHVLTPKDVPASLTRAFAETSGRTDRVVLLFPSLAIDYNNARNVIRFSDELSSVKLPPDSVAGGAFLFMAEILRLIKQEAPRVVLVVCGLVALVLLPIFRRRPLRIPLVVATVAVVAFSAQCVMFAVGVQLNMLNFAAIPITIGVGADYVVNLLGAMDAWDVDARRATARMGGAILLCSLTTIVGYLTLLFAHSGALRSFGWAAVLGELMAVATVLVVLPALLPAKQPGPDRPSARADAPSGAE